MKWFRRHIETGSRLALFALALQFVLSFGHFHFDAARAAAAMLSQTDLAHAQGQALDGPSQPQQQPPGHDDSHPANEPCAICAVMSMANRMVVAAPVVLPLPDAAEHAFLSTSAEFALAGTPRPAFQSRAPPVS